MAAAEVRGLDVVLAKIKKLSANTRLATARAVNDTLVQAQTFTTQKLLPSKFTLRGRGKRWFERGNKLGFNIRFAKPDNATGTLGSQADFLKLQEEGGTKKADGHRVAIPDEKYKPKADLMRRDMKPRAIRGDPSKERALKAALQGAQGSLTAAESALAAHRNVRLATKADKQRRHDLKLRVKSARQEFRKASKAHKTEAGRGAAIGGKAFVAEMGSGFVGIFKRLGKGRFPLKLLFSLTSYAHLDPILGFEKAAGDLANENYDPNFRKRFLEVMK